MITPSSISGLLFRVAILFSWFGCSQESIYQDKDVEFLEVGEPLVGEPVVDTQNVYPPKIAPPVENNSSEIDEKKIVEGEIILGQTLLGSEGNLSSRIVNNLPPHDPVGGYEMMPYSKLTEFPYEIDWESDGLTFEFSAFASRVPRNVRNLSGKKVALEGFMVPTVVNEQNMVQEFLLMPDQLSCCFGQAPEANGWVVVVLTGGWMWQWTG